MAYFPPTILATTLRSGTIKAGVGTIVSDDGTLTTTGSAFVGAIIASSATLPATALGSITPINSSTNVTLTLPSASAAFLANPYGIITLSQTGVGIPTFTAGSGDTLRATSGVGPSVQYGMIYAQVISSTEWALA